MLIAGGVKEICAFKPFIGKYDKVQKINIAIAIQIGFELCQTLGYCECLITCVTGELVI